jgi:hypothetical protein
MKLTAYRTHCRWECHLLPSLIYRPRPYTHLGWLTLSFRWIWWGGCVWWGEAKG